MEANLKLNPEKCNLFQKNVCFLGHVISESGIATDPKKIGSVKNWPTPKTLKDLRSFLGLCSYYRRYVFQFSTIAKPLHKLTEKVETFSWTQECDNAFNRLKHTLINAPILAYPLSEGEFILDTDASGFGISGVLSQLQNNEEKVIAYYSKCLSKAERRYCVTWRELLAVVNSVQQFHHYLYGQHFMVRTDHASLRWLTNFKNPEGQLARWIELLSTYDFQIVHRVGRSHSNADALSRRPCENEGCAYCERAETKFKSADIACCARVTYEINPVSVCKHYPSFLSKSQTFVTSTNETPFSFGVVTCERQRSDSWTEKHWNATEIDNKETSKPEVIINKHSLSPRHSSACDVHSEAHFTKECMLSNKDETGTGANKPSSSHLTDRASERKSDKRVNRTTSSDSVFSDGRSPDGKIQKTVDRKFTRNSLNKETSFSDQSTLPNQCCNTQIREQTIDSKYAIFKSAQEADPTIRLLKEWKTQQFTPSWSDISEHSAETKFYWNRLDSLLLRYGLLCRKWESETGDSSELQIILPGSLSSEILAEFHDSPSGGHLGITKTLSKIRLRLFWYGMRRDVKEWCRKCDRCAMRKTPKRKPRSALKQYNVGLPLERVGIDIIGPVIQSNLGNKYILTICDYFTKFVVAVPMKNQEARTVV